MVRTLEELRTRTPDDPNEAAPEAIMERPWRDFMQFIFAPIPTEANDWLISELPFLDVSQPAASLGLWLLNFIYHHSVFLNPGTALFVQCYGFSMGTNRAPQWAQLTLRSFEELRPLPPGIRLLRFLDDGLVLHRASKTEKIKTCLQRMYPKDLPFAFEALGSAREVTFLDVRFISVEVLRTSVFWKNTHVCAYMPWTTNVPRHIREFLEFFFGIFFGIFWDEL